MNFDELVKSLDEDGTDSVDARLLSPFWEERWVVYADLIAFAERSHSQQIVVNNLVRFHRAVLTSTAAHAGRVYRMTDAVFVSCDSLSAALGIASNIQHECLGMNHNAYVKKAPLAAHFTILPRITIGYGTLLQFGEAPPPAQLAGVHFDTFVAGTALLSAYGIEKKSSGGLISVHAKSLQERVSVEPPALRGSNTDICHTVASKWLASVASSDATHWRHDGVVDVPWLLLRPRCPNHSTELWTDEQGSLSLKLQAMEEIGTLWKNDFLLRALPVDVGKHHAALLRHLEFIRQGLAGRNGLRPWGQ